jgi:Tfp pilus assembly protein PilO
MRRGSWIVTVPLVAATVAYLMWVFLPGRKAIGQLRNEIAEKQQQATDGISMGTTLSRGKQELEKTNGYVTGCRKQFASEKDLAFTLAKIHTLADAAAVRIMRFEPQTSIDYETFHSVPVVVGCTGSFSQVYEFVRTLEQTPSQICVNSVRIDQIAGFGNSVKCEVALEVFVDNSENSDYAKRPERPI